MAFYDVDNAMTVKLDYELPKVPAFREGIRRAPRREEMCIRDSGLTCSRRGGSKKIP